MDKSEKSLKKIGQKYFCYSSRTELGMFGYKLPYEVGAEMRFLGCKRAVS